MSSSSLAEIEAEVRARSKAIAQAEEKGNYQKVVSFFTPDAVIQRANAPQFQGLTNSWSFMRRSGSQDSGCLFLSVTQLMGFSGDL